MTNFVDQVPCDSRLLQSQPVRARGDRLSNEVRLLTVTVQTGFGPRPPRREWSARGLFVSPPPFGGGLLMRNFQVWSYTVNPHFLDDHICALLSRSAPVLGLVHLRQRFAF